MKARIPLWLLAFVTCLIALSSEAADGNPPERLTFQGFLADGNGNALAPNAPRNYDVIFRIYDSQSGGTLKWTEQQTVTVDKGYFNVLLGEGSAVGAEPRPLLSNVFGGADASDRFVGFTVKGIGPSGVDVDILPRQRVLTSPYSFLAKQAISIVGGVSDSSLSANVALLNRDQTFTGANTFNGALVATNSNNQLGGTFVGTPTFNSGILMNDKPIYLHTLTDTNNYLKYDTTAGGPVLVGTNGGKLMSGLTGGTTALAWNNNGNVGIGTAAVPSYKLYVNGGIGLAGDVTGVSALNASTLNAGTLNVSTVSGGNVYASGWFYCSFGGSWWAITKAGDNNAYWSSDQRLKRDIATFPNALTAIKQLRGVTYHWNEEGLKHLTRDVEQKWKSKSGKPEDDKKLWDEKRAEQYKELNRTQMGFIAQEVERVFPDWVNTDEKGFRQINMQKLGAVLVNAVREQQEQIEIQQKQISELKAALAQQRAALDEKAALEKRLAAIEKALGGALTTASNK
jgi:hypothetical protein